MAEFPATDDRRVSLPPKNDLEADLATQRIISLHGGSHIIRLIKEMKPNANLQEIYEGVRGEALINCSRLLDLPESWALDGKMEKNLPKFSPKSGEPLDTPEARLTLVEYRISEHLGKGNKSSLELLRRIDVGTIHLSGTAAKIEISAPSPETAKAVDLKALKCEQCGAYDFHFDSELFKQLAPTGGEKPLFGQMVVDPGERVAIIQRFDSSAMFKPSAPITLKCEHCQTDHTLGDPVSGAIFLAEFKRHYENKGYTVIVQAKKN